jgi:hypothetical protein
MPKQPRRQAHLAEDTEGNTCHDRYDNRKYKSHFVFSSSFPQTRTDGRLAKLKLLTAQRGQQGRQNYTAH